MTKPNALADDKMLARLKHEQDKHGLVLGENTDEDTFHKVVKRLIDEPPAPKQKRRARRAKPHKR